MWPFDALESGFGNSFSTDTDGSDPEEFSSPTRLPRYSDEEIQGIRDLEATNVVSRLWKQPRKFAVAIFLVWALVPFSVFCAIGVVQGTLFIDGGHGVLEANTFLTYFPTSFLLLVAVTHALRSLRSTLNSLAGLARLQEDTEYLKENRFKSTLTAQDMNQLFDFYEFVIAKVTFRSSAEGVALPGSDGWNADRLDTGDAADDDPPGSNAGPAPPRTDGGTPDRDPSDGDRSTGDDVELLENFRRTWRWYFVYPFTLIFLGGVMFFVIATYQHWTAFETYGTELWSSEQHQLGFFARMVYDFMLYVIMGPYIATAMSACILLMHHALTRMERKNGIRFLRFSIDEAGGFGEFGQQSLRNTFVLLPFIIPIAVSIIFLPINMLTLVGIFIWLGSIPLMFFWPLLGARRAMKSMKTMELEILSSTLIDKYEVCKKNLERTDSNDMNTEEFLENGEVIERAEIMYDGVKRQPAWPFGKRLITQFASLMTAAAGAMGSLLGLFGDLSGVASIVAGTLGPLFGVFGSVLVALPI